MIEYQTASLPQVRMMLDWAREEGWNPGLDDAPAFYAADPDGFFVATEDGQPVAGISVVNHTDRYAFLGLYIVRPAHRGRGIGYALWQHALCHAGDRTVGLDGVPDQQANYAASGFVKTGGTARFIGTVEPHLDPALRPTSEADLPDLIEKEAALSGIRKERFLSAWLQDNDIRKTWVGEGGFCTIRRCHSGAKIGPLYAKSPDVAESLIRHAATQFGPDVILDVPSSAPDLGKTCASLGMTAGFDTARMYRGAPPGITASGLLSPSTLELG